jgi:decaprenyl-phosphate phosphoribosyltransferase
MSTTINHPHPTADPVDPALASLLSAGGPSTRLALRAAVRAVRPHQWVKNVLVVGAPAAAGTLFGGPVLVRLAATIIAMCAAASATYLVNDLGDIERDRVHPTKRYRPIASGELHLATARLAAVVLGATALLLGLSLGPATAAALAAYLALTISYSRWLKHVPVVELCVVAAGFVLRVMAGATATATALSVPFLVVVMAGSFFLATGKRLSEIIELGDSASTHRPVLAHYRRRELERLLAGSLAIMLVGYSAWAVSADIGRDRAPWLILSMVPILAAVGRLTRLTLRGEAGDPTRLALHDRPLQIAGAVGALLVAAGLYLM